jgi:hypothetical protein
MTGSTAVLLFPLGDVVGLAGEAMAARQRLPSFAQRYAADGSEIADPAVPPSLWWVKDEGTYLMSNADAAGRAPKVVYGIHDGEALTGDRRELVERVCGGDDFVECLELGGEEGLAVWLHAMHACGRYRFLRLEASPETLAVAVQP